MRPFPVTKASSQRAAGRKLAAPFSGNVSAAVWNFLHVYGLAEHVQIVLDADAEGTRAEKISRAAASLGQAGSLVYVIGDAVSDVQAARQACALSVAVTWGHQSRVKLEGARPDYVVGSPKELLQLFARLQVGGCVEIAGIASAGSFRHYL